METPKNVQKDIMSENENKSPIKIFSTPKGLNVVKSPVKSIILSALREKELSFDEIVKVTGKSKSTVSVHLKALSQDGVIGSKTHPADQRKKIFFINSRYIGELNQNEVQEREEEKVEFLIKNLINKGDPFEFFRLMFHTLRVVMIKEGINLDPILNQTGMRIGEVFYRQLENKKTSELLKNLADFWVSNGLGRLEIENLNPITVRAYDCFECGLLPNVGESACALDSGILEAVFSAHLSQEIIVNEIKCYAKGDKYCCFVIEPLETLSEEELSCD
jgi:predicted hydrocarbon binding protein/predicted transcriptional regulator